MKLFNFLSDAKPPLIQQSVNDLLAMIDRASEMFALATGALLDNEAVQVDLAAMDDDINTREGLIRRAVLEHVAVNPQQELSFSLVMVAIVQDAERCGDLAKSLSKAAALSDAPRMGRHVAVLASIRDRVQAQFPLVHAAFSSGDAEGAAAVMNTHEAVKAEVGDLLSELARADDVSPNEAVVLGISARMIGRVSSHLSNIISAIALPFDQLRRS
ncbi:MAG: PhoU domain-containing protein, partial [Bacteroidota bacterium]